MTSPEALHAAAEAGDAEACNTLGQQTLAAGDPGAAAGWFRRAGELGSADAWFSLGRLFGQGAGVPQDMDQAHDCMRRAAALGDERARGFVRDALGEDPDAPPTPPPPQPPPEAKPTAGRKGAVLSFAILGVLVVAAIGGVAYLLAPEDPDQAALAEAGDDADEAADSTEALDSPTASAAVADPEADQGVTDAASPDAAAAKKTQVFSVFAGDGYPASPRADGALLTRTLGLQASASSHAAGIDDADVHYDASHAIDGEPDTWWQEGAADSGVDEWLTVKWAKPAPVAVIRLVPGYLKRRSDRFGDRWPLNNRLARLALDFGEGRTHTVHLDDQRGWHDITIEPPITTDQVKLTIEAVFAGKDKRTGEAVNDSGISEIQVWTASP